MGTKIRPINLHTSVDTHIQGLIDSSFVQARSSGGTDSAATQAMIDSSISFQVDSAYVLARAPAQDFLDSSEAIALIDSAYVLARAPAGTDSSSIQAMIDSNFAHDITFGGAAGTQAYTFDGSDVVLDSSSAVFFDKSDKSLKFGDNYKAKFGASGDLEIYHDTVNGNSVIHDNGSGNLRIRADDFQVTNAAANANLIFANDGTGEVKLYHNGSEKIATASGGIDVTGNIAVSGTVDGRDLATDGTKLDGIAASATNVSNTNQLTNGAGFITASSSDTLTNKALTDPVVNDHLDIVKSGTTGGMRIGPSSGFAEIYDIAIDSGDAGGFTGLNFKMDNNTIMSFSTGFSGQQIQLHQNVFMHTGKTIEFEGSTDDGNHTVLTVQDPTAGRTVTLPNMTGRVNELLITEGSMNASSLVFNSSTITTEYSELRLVLSNCKPSSQTGVYMRVGSSNSGDGGTNYGQAIYYSGYYGSSTSFGVSYVDHDATYFILAEGYAQLGTGTGQNGHFEITFLNPNTSSHYKFFKINSQIYSYYPMLMGRYIDAAVWKSTAAINYIQVYPGSGNLSLAYKLYGTKN